MLREEVRHLRRTQTEEGFIDLTAASAEKLKWSLRGADSSIVEELEAGQRGPTDTSVGVQLTGNESISRSHTALARIWSGDERSSF